MIGVVVIYLKLERPYVLARSFTIIAHYCGTPLLSHVILTHASGFSGAAAHEKLVPSSQRMLPSTCIAARACMDSGASHSTCVRPAVIAIHMST